MTGLTGVIITVGSAGGLDTAPVSAFDLLCRFSARRTLPTLTSSKQWPVKYNSTFIAKEHERYLARVKLRFLLGCCSFADKVQMWGSRVPADCTP